MEVFVLMGGWNYEGDAPLGVYVSEQEAVDAHGVYTRDDDRGFDSFFILSLSIGAPADLHGALRRIDL